MAELTLNVMGRTSVAYDTSYTTYIDTIRGFCQVLFDGIWSRGESAARARYTGDHHGLRSRQLRFVYLQPRPVPGGVGGADRCAAQRRVDGGRSGSAEAGADPA